MGKVKHSSRGFLPKQVSRLDKSADLAVLAAHIVRVDPAPRLHMLHHRVEGQIEAKAIVVLHSPDDLMTW
jgi:hypothetical protein